MTEDRPQSLLDQIRRAYEETERKSGDTMEGLVGTDAFSDMLAMVVGNAMSLSRVSGTVLDDVVRRTRLAGRTDVTRLAQQLARTEDKMETLLQHIESLQDEVSQLRRDLAATATKDKPAGTTEQDA